MAQPYPGNATQYDRRSADAVGPAIHRLTSADLIDALRLGWEDFKAVPSHAIMLCLIYPLVGLVLARAVLGYSILPLLFPLAAGFALIGPFAALGLYELSRRREIGDTPSAGHALDVLRSPSFGAMLGLGAMLLVLFVTWIATAQAIYVATFGHAPASGIPDFVSQVLTTPARHERHLPQPTAAGSMTLSPTLSRRTLLPISTTSPTASWPTQKPMSVEKPPPY